MVLGTHEDRLLESPWDMASGVSGRCDTPQHNTGSHTDSFPVDYCVKMYFHLLNQTSKDGNRKFPFNFGVILPLPSIITIVSLKNKLCVSEISWL